MRRCGLAVGPPCSKPARGKGSRDNVSLEFTIDPVFLVAVRLSCDDGFRRRSGDTSGSPWRLRPWTASRRHPRTRSAQVFPSWGKERKRVASGRSGLRAEEERRTRISSHFLQFTLAFLPVIADSALNRSARMCVFFMMYMWRVFFMIYAVYKQRDVEILSTVISENPIFVAIVFGSGAASCIAKLAS